MGFQDLQRLQIQFDGEKQRRVDLELQLAKMNQLLSTGQEALQQEQKTVDMLRQQVTSAPSSASSSANAAAKVSFLEVTSSKKCYSYYKGYSHLRHFTSF